MIVGQLGLKAIPNGPLPAVTVPGLLGDSVPFPATLYCETVLSESSGT